MDSSIAVLVLLIALAGFGWWMWHRARHTPGLYSGASTPPKTSVPALSVACISGPMSGQQVGFTRSWLTFGRAPNNDVVIDSTTVSRHHAMINVTPQGAMLSDLGSTNGTWMGGRRVLEHPLAENESWQIGPCVFTLIAQGRVAASQPVSLPASPALPSVSMSMARSVEISSYDRLELIGDGGAAYVYKIRHHQSGDLAALKILKEQADPYFKRRFGDEGLLGLQLSHPHIVTVFGTGESHGIRYIIMEYLEGRSLRERLLPDRSFDLGQLTAIVGQIGQALDYAHERGVFHRDIKPENILFTRDGLAKLGDFGIARVAGVRRYTSEGMLIGTPEYMSYEQAKGIELDGRSDQYSLAVVMYEALAGRPPFTATNPLTVVEKHLSETPRPLRDLNPAVPASVERVIMRALSKDRNRRYPTMADMTVALGYRPPTGFVSFSKSRPAAHCSARLVHIDTRRVWDVGRQLELGRAMVDDPLVSRHHAVIRANGRAYFIDDLGSRNGTYIEGQRIVAPTVLQPGARIHLGPVAFQFLVDESPGGRRLT